MFHTINPEVMLYGTLLFAMWIAALQGVMPGRTRVDRIKAAVVVTAICAVMNTAFLFVSLKLIAALNAA